MRSLNTTCIRYNYDTQTVSNYDAEKKLTKLTSPYVSQKFPPSSLYEGKTLATVAVVKVINQYVTVG